MKEIPELDRALQIVKLEADSLSTLALEVRKIEIDDLGTRLVLIAKMGAAMTTWARITEALADADLLVAKIAKSTESAKGMA